MQTKCKGGRGERNCLLMVIGILCQKDSVKVDLQMKCFASDFVDELCVLVNVLISVCGLNCEKLNCCVLGELLTILQQKLRSRTHPIQNNLLNLKLWFAWCMLAFLLLFCFFVCFVPCIFCFVLLPGIVTMPHVPPVQDWSTKGMKWLTFVGIMTLMVVCYCIGKASFLPSALSEFSENCMSH